MFMIIADGIPWCDSDGNTEWPEREAITLAALLESPGMDYRIEMERVSS